MSQRSNRKAKFVEKLRKQGYNFPGTSQTKSIPLGYNFGCVVARPGSHIATERTEK